MNPHTYGSVWLFHSVAYYDQRSYTHEMCSNETCGCSRTHSIFSRRSFRSSIKFVSLARKYVLWECICSFFMIIIWSAVRRRCPCSFTHTHRTCKPGSIRTAFYGILRWCIYYILHIAFSAPQQPHANIFFFTFLFTQIVRRGNWLSNNNTTNKTKFKHLSLFFTNLLAAIACVQCFRNFRIDEYETERPRIVEPVEQSRFKEHSLAILYSFKFKCKHISLWDCSMAEIMAVTVKRVHQKPPDSSAMRFRNKLICLQRIFDILWSRKPRRMVTEKHISLMAERQEADIGCICIRFKWTAKFSSIRIECGFRTI